MEMQAPWSQGLQLQKQKKGLAKMPMCKECQEWLGRCGKGYINKVASDSACQDFIRAATLSVALTDKGKDACRLVLA
jgi:hypothetical protein